MDFAEKDAEIEDVADGEFEEEEGDESQPHGRHPAVSSTLEHENYTQLKLGTA